MTSTCGLRYDVAARATRERCPPERQWMVVVCRSPATPVEASCFLSSCSCPYEPSPGNCECINMRGVIPRSSWSAWCWFTSANRAPWSRRTKPAVGSRRPIMTLTSVVLPAPFSPRRQMRDLPSTWRLTPSKRGVSPPYPKATFSSCTTGSSSSPPPVIARDSSSSSSRYASSCSSSSASASSLSSCFTRCILALMVAWNVYALPCLRVYSRSLSRFACRSSDVLAHAACISARLAEKAS
mmetsp:Transcript_11536/g.28274  ORF Transcript_11536/g.28274 Transcript_11536/m.28274 type:complete len:240 (-) Transcript_11536:1568-2287(-)